MLLLVQYLLHCLQASLQSCMPPSRAQMLPHKSRRKSSSWTAIREAQPRSLRGQFCQGELVFAQQFCQALRYVRPWQNCLRGQKPSATQSRRPQDLVLRNLHARYI